MQPNKNLQDQLQDISSLEDFNRHLRSIPSSDIHNKITFCQSAIEIWENRISNSNPNRGESYTDIAFMYLSLAQIYESINRIKAVREALQQALYYAETAKDDDTIFSILLAGGLCFGRLHADGEPDAWEQAVSWLQRSLKHIRSQYSHQVIAVFRSLGHIWADNPVTYHNAQLMYEWLLIIEEAPLADMVDRFRLMRLLNEENTVREISNAQPQNDLYDIAQIASACWALSRKRRAKILAKQGFELAAEVGETKWKDAFQYLIEKKG